MHVLIGEGLVSLAFLTFGEDLELILQRLQWISKVLENEFQLQDLNFKKKIQQMQTMGLIEVQGNKIQTVDSYLLFFLQSLVQPLIETYWVSAFSLT